MPASPKAVTVAPLFNRCVEIKTSRGLVQLKVMGDESTAVAERNLVVAALTNAGLKLAEPSEGTVPETSNGKAKR